MDSGRGDGGCRWKAKKCGHSTYRFEALCFTQLTWPEVIWTWKLWSCPTKDTRRLHILPSCPEVGLLRTYCKYLVRWSGRNWPIWAVAGKNDDEGKNTPDGKWKGKNKGVDERISTKMSCVVRWTTCDVRTKGIKANVNWNIGGKTHEENRDATHPEQTCMTRNIGAVCYENEPNPMKDPPSIMYTQNNSCMYILCTLYTNLQL